jgi:hypothetical protein
VFVRRTRRKEELGHKLGQNQAAPPRYRQVAARVAANGGHGEKGLAMIFGWT